MNVSDDHLKVGCSRTINVSDDHLKVGVAPKLL